MKNNNIFIKNGDQYVKLELEKILWARSIGGSCDIHTNNDKYSVSFSFKKLMQSFPSNQFLRIHEHYIINLIHIASVDLLQNTVLLNDEEIPIGSDYKDQLISRLNVFKP